MDLTREIEALKQRIAALKSPLERDWGETYDLLWLMAQSMNQSEESFVTETGLKEEYIERMRNHTRRFLL